MKIDTENVDDKTQISRFQHEWADATRKDEKDKVLSNHAHDVLIFDVLAPLQYKGAEAYRKSWVEWWPTSEEESLFDIQELSITASETVAFAHGLIKCGGTPTIDWVRITFCLCKTNGKWMITHQHGSMPVDKKNSQTLPWISLMAANLT